MIPHLKVKGAEEDMSLGVWGLVRYSTSSVVNGTEQAKDERASVYISGSEIAEVEPRSGDGDSAGPLRFGFR